MGNVTSHDKSHSFAQQSTPSRSAPLSDEFIKAFVTELDSDDVIGIGMGGSHVRGEATPYSDVDLMCFFSDTVLLPKKRFIYRDGRLVGIATRTVAGVRRDFTRPEIALHAVPMMQELRILLDKDGSIGVLQRDALDFSWESVQEAANAYARSMMMSSTEQVHKMLGILLNDDALAFSSAMTTFPVHLAQLLAIQRGVLIKTDSRFFYQLQESIGLTSAWTQAHLRAVSIEPPPADVPSLQWRASAFLSLYLETVNLLRPIMHPTECEVIEQTLRMIEASGFAQWDNCSDI